jgi:hypothetical protein
VHASGARYVTGSPYFWSNSGNPVGWFTATPLYFTDPGNLSVYVNHQAADALVAAAANVWNVPVANLTLAQGGTLAEHVSGANVYLGSSGLVYPADVANSNYQAIQIPVIYDSDGSVTDTLLGQGASDPADCRQNGVTESVDWIDPTDYIFHAVLILNGRCTGPAPAQQLQLQYQLMRAFGRVLGLAWSQTNDNIFTGTPEGTYAQALQWPILHPIDILCGSYSYQCLPQPFQLRMDDVASLVRVYGIGNNTSPILPGKQISLTQADFSAGNITFPTGEGMAGVNVLAARVSPLSNMPESWASGSNVTGMQFRRVTTTPVSAPPGTVYGGEGSSYNAWQGYYQIQYIPLDAGWNVDNLVITSEPVNPLYTGNYSVGPYATKAVAPSGSAIAREVFGGSNGGGIEFNFTIADAAPLCGDGADGSAARPLQADATGWWNGLLCGYAHFAWTALDVRPARTLTFEVTALDEQGYATTAKAMPVMGVWGLADSTTSLPTVAATVSPFNSVALGMTTLTLPTGSQTGLSFVVADQRGDGRPDYGYQARIFYADSITPSLVPAAGGSVTITGMGFRGGNSVSVNGVKVTPVSWTSNSIVLTVPSMAAASAASGQAVDVVVSDLSTGATSTMSGALTYDTAATLPDLMKLVSVEVAPIFAGDATAVPFSVQILGGNGVTPLAGVPVAFSGSVAGTAGSVVFGACGVLPGMSPCVVTSNAQGIASTSVTPGIAGTVAIQAVDQASTALMQSAIFTAQSKAGSMVVVSAPAGAVYVGNSAPAAFSVQVLAPDGKTPDPGRAVTFSAPAGAVTFDTCVATTCIVTTNGQGIASTGVTPIASGAVTIKAADGAVTQSASFAALANVPVLVVTSAPSGSYPVGTRAPQYFEVYLFEADRQTPMIGQPITYNVSELSGGATADGINFGPCSSATCTVNTDYLGRASTWVNLGHTGTYVLQAAFGSIVQTTTILVVPNQGQVRIISAPTGNQAVGSVTSAPFKVQAVQSDGVTPLAGFAIVLSGVPGTVNLSSCSYNCFINVDSNGYASVTVTPLVLGQITLQAVIAGSSVTAQFNGVANGDGMTLLSVPGGTIYPGGVTNGYFAVKVTGPDHVTPLAGRQVTFAITQGTGEFQICWLNSPCLATTDANGMVQSQIYVASSGTFSLLASESGNSIGGSFNVTAPPDQLFLRSAPSGNIPVGTAAAAIFSVQAFLWDGVTPAANHSITLAVTGVSASLSACAQTSCTIMTDANGNAWATVTPLAVGTVSLLAADGPSTRSATFNAVAAPDVLRLVSAPSGSVTVGSAASPAFAVQVLASNGATPIAGRTVTLSLTSGSASFSGCSATPCVLVSDANGLVATIVTPQAAGLVALLASDGTITQSASFTAVAAPDILRLVSAPSGPVSVGSAASRAFSVQVLASNGATPNTGRSVTLSLTSGTASFSGCSATPCVLVSDANGLVSAAVTPQAAGMIGLLASDGTVTQSASFTAVAAPDVLRLVSAPNGPVFVGSAAAPSFSVQVLASNGATPITGRSVTLSLTSGTASFSGCSATPCVLVSDADGLVSSTVTPQAAGLVGLLASDGTVTQVSSFTAVAAPDVLRLVSAPLGPVTVGTTAAPAFAVQVLASNGTTPIAGRSVTLSPASGTASLSGCSTTPCVLISDVNGLVSTTVTPQAAGVIGLLASDGAITQSASFMAVAAPDVLRLVIAPSGPVFVGSPASPAFSVQVLAANGNTPIAGRSVTLSLTSGTASLSGCSATPCILVSDANGLVSTTLTPQAAGLIGLLASDGAITQSASFTAIANTATLVPTSAQLFVAEGAVFAWPLSVTATWDGVPANAIPLAWTSSPGITLSGSQTITSTAGTSSAAASIGPLAAALPTAVSATATACAWTSVCTSFQVSAVSSSLWQVRIVSGTGQAVSGGTAFMPLTAQVIDGAGHAIAGAPVTIYQAVTERNIACPVHGRCPAAPVLASGSAQAVTDANGGLTVIPLTYNGVSTSTNIAISAGTQGFAAANLVKTP